MHNARDGSAGSRTSAGNMSHGSIGSMNVSAGGYGSDFGPNKGGAPA